MMQFKSKLGTTCVKRAKVCDDSRQACTAGHKAPPSSSHYCLRYISCELLSLTCSGRTVLQYKLNLNLFTMLSKSLQRSRRVSAYFWTCRTKASVTASEVPDMQKVRQPDDGEEFRVLELTTKRVDRFKKRTVPLWKLNIPPPRSRKMSTTQDWPSVWPAARMFHPAVVPLPVHMGHIKRPDIKAPPGKFANLELMKIPNFLHLAPPAIKRHCDALKKFCTKWPEELQTDEDCHSAFPLEYIFRDYVHAAPTIRDPRSRIVTVRFKLSDIQLDYHAKIKIMRLLNGNETKRYNEKTNLVTIVADRCPLKQQNYDYLNYVLTAVYFEAWKKDAWEEHSVKADWEKYYFEKSPSAKNVIDYMKRVCPDDIKDDRDILERSEVKLYAKAVSDLYDTDESDEAIDEYKRSVIQLLFNDSKTTDNVSADSH